MQAFPINKTIIAKLFFFAFLVSLFFPIRHVFITSTSFKTGAYSDFTSISLYLSDIFLFLSSLFTFLPRGEKKPSFNSDKWILGLLTLWLIVVLISHFKSLTALNYWSFAKFIELLVAYETSKRLFMETSIKGLFIRLFVALSSLQAILGLLQFGLQHSIGGILHKLGEQVISPRIEGIAKIVSGGTTYIRAYGTFPHPNLLSAFLLVGVVLSIYLFFTAKSLKSEFFYSFAIFINLLGLTVTFSRAAFLSLGVGLLIFFIGQALNTGIRSKKLLRAVLITLIAVLLCFFTFRPFLSTRATINDSSSLERIFYGKIGVKIVKENPIFGVGIGEGVLHMQQYLPALNSSDQLEVIKIQSGSNLQKFQENKQKFMAGEPTQLQPWQIQPIHNYFLLTAAEIGIPGALILIWLLFSHLIKLGQKMKSENSPYLYSLFSILLSFLALMQFDHYFYTLQQTQMLLWVTLGIISAEIKKSQAGK